MKQSNSSITTREKILRYLLFYGSNSMGGITIKDLAAELRLSTNATRQYMIVLEKEGLILRLERKGTTGRPAMLYKLHENAFDSFPKVYKDFSLDLLEVLKEKYGINETRNILELVGLKIASDLKNYIESDSREKYTNMTLKQKLESINEAFNHFGRYPQLIEEEDHYKIKTHNCLVYGIVKEEPLVCTVDETLMNILVGHKTIKKTCIRDGDDSCQYMIEKISEEAKA